MKEYRDAYRKDDRIKFKKNAYKYLYRNTKEKTIGGLCDHLHITRYSLCKYKSKDGYWKNTVNDIKIFLELFNMLEIRGEMDVSAEGIDKIIDHLERIIEIRRYDYVKNEDQEDQDQESNDQIKINPINYDEMEKYEEDGTVYYEDEDGNLYYPNEE